MVSEALVYDQLHNVIDPELGINIVDLGLVYRVDIAEDRVSVDYTLTYIGCPLGDILKRDIIQEVGTIQGVSEVEANLVWVPPWSPDLMTDEARIDMGYPI